MGLGYSSVAFPQPPFQLLTVPRSVGRPCTIRHRWRTVFVLRFAAHVIPSHVVRRRRRLSNCYVYCKQRPYARSGCGMLSGFQLYLAGYLLTLTYAKTSQATQIITTIRKPVFQTYT